MSYLLDTNSWIALMRWQNAGILAQLKQHPSDEILLCSIVLAELLFGVERSDAIRRANNLKLLDELAAKYESLPFDYAAARDYATIRAHLFATGQPIGPGRRHSPFFRARVRIYSPPASRSAPMIC